MEGNRPAWSPWMERDGERLFLIGLSHVEFLSPKEKMLLVEMLGGARPLFSLALSDIARLLGRRMWTAQWRPDEILRSAEQTEKTLTGGPLGCIFYWDPAYPPRLREIFDPPLTLYWRGTLPEIGKILAGIVGTRFPTGAARRAAFRLGFELGREGIGVVSGLAKGIDREAHEGCTEAGGYSLAVLGNGIDVVYPASSRPAAIELLAGGGLIVSEYPPGTPPRPYHFPARNRIVSGLSRSVVVVQAPARSGALITAEYALEQGRDLFVHTAGLQGTAGAGTRGLANAGALVIRDSADIMRDWGIHARSTPHAAVSPRAGVQESTSRRLVRMLEEEIAGSRIVKGGETYWRG